MNMRFNAAGQWKSIRGNHGDSKRASTGRDHVKPFVLVVDQDTSFARLVTRSYDSPKLSDNLNRPAVGNVD